MATRLRRAARSRRPGLAARSISNPRPVRLQSNGCSGRALELLGERQPLALVGGADPLAVELGRALGQRFEEKAADGLTILDHEGHVVGAHFEDRARAAAAGLVMAEAGVEEPRIVGAELADERIVGHHLGGMVGRYAHRFLRRQDVEVVGVQDHPAAGEPRNRLPEVLGLVTADHVDVDHAGMALRLPAHQAFAVAGKVDRERQPTREPLAPDLAFDQPTLVVEPLERTAGIAGVAALEAELVQPAAGANHDAEGAGRDLGIERPAVAAPDPVELVRFVGDEASEDIEPPGRALGVGVGRDVPRQREALHQRHDVDAAPLQHGAGHEVDLVHAEPRDLGTHALAARQEARAHPVRRRPEPEVQARRLDLRRPDGRVRSDPAALDQRGDRGARQDSGLRRHL